MITALATMIRPTILRTNLCCSMSIFAEVAMLSSFEGVAARCMSVLVEQNPGRECEDDHQRRIDERHRTEIRLQVAHLNNPVRDEGQRKAAIKRSRPVIATRRDRSRRTRGGLLLLPGATRTNSAFIFVVA